jgi:hypothetical protein
MSLHQPTPRGNTTSGWPPDPPPPGSAWVDALRWLVCVMDSDDRGSLAFVASCLAWALNHDGTLTERQARACQKVLQRVTRAWHAGILDVQIDRRLADVEPAGRA